MAATPSSDTDARLPLYGFDPERPPLDDHQQLVLWCEMLAERKPVTAKLLADLLWKARLTYYDKDMTPAYA